MENYNLTVFTARDRNRVYGLCMHLIYSRAEKCSEAESPFGK